MRVVLFSGLLWSVFLLSLGCYMAQADRLLRRFYPDYGNSWTRCASSVFLLAPTLFILRNLHLPLVFFGVIMLLFMAIWLRPLDRMAPSAYWFWVNLHTIFFGVGYLIVYAALSFFLQLTPYAAWQLRWPGLFSLAVTLFLLALVSLIAKRQQTFTYLSFLMQDDQRLKQLLYFSYFALAYLFFDALGCAIDLPYQFVNGFLAGSCLLLLAEFLLFVDHACRIAKHAHFEQEYYQLAQQRQQNIQTELHLQKLIETDALTGVYTRRYAMDFLKSLARDKDRFSLAYIDLNGLKKVNDRAGHFAGDQYLVAAAEILDRCLRSDDVLARLGGDEFVVISPGREADSLDEVLSKANAQLQASQGTEASFSWGISQTNADQTDWQALLELADQRMYARKKAQKGDRS